MVGPLCTDKVPSRNGHFILIYLFPGEEFQFLDPTAEEMDNGYVFSPVSF